PWKPGEVAVTGAGRLKAKYVIHAVGPIYGEEGEEKLAEAVRNSLQAADRLGLRTLALPAISTGVYGYPMEICAKVMKTELGRFSKRKKSLELVTICLYGKDSFERFVEAFRQAP
ncbi:MAG: macro domain-containing protein, partial [Candidatus Hadarchaeales archaeon]